MLRFFSFIGYIRYCPFSVAVLISATIVLVLALGLTPGLGKLLFDKVFVTFDPLLLFKYVGIQVFIVACTALLTLVYTLHETHLTLRIADRIKLVYFRRLLRTGFSFFKDHDTGFLVKRIIEDSGAIADGVAKFFTIVCNFMMIVTFGVILRSIQNWLFILYASLIAGSFLWMLLWMLPIHRFNMKIGHEYSHLYKLFWEMLGGIKEIKLQNLQGIIAAKISRTNDRTKDALLLNAVFNTCMWQYAYLFWAVGYSAVLIYGLQRIEAGQLSIGMLLGLLSLVFYLLDPVQKIYGAIGVLQSGVAAAQRIQTIQSAAEEQRGDTYFTEFNNSIELKDVSFSYDGKKNVLESVSMRFPKGAKVAIVGKTGSGKTTIVNLLLKLYNGFSGSICIDGVSLDQYDTDSIRRKIVFISQDVQIFRDSIRNNIDFSRTLSDSALAEIIRAVNLDSLVSRLPEGVDTVIGDEGIDFSGGERQRIAIARCLAIDPEIVVFDEITASLDAQNDMLILTNLMERFREKTVIAISHRQSIVNFCPMVYVLKEGAVAEQGSPAELLNRSGEFRRNFLIEE